jgi:hypothetical protein
MAGLDPLNVNAALIDAALNLGVPVDILQTQISLGDLLAATILPPQQGQDLIEILGQRVVAQLPADVHPGDTLVLQVTGFRGNQILVRNLGAYDPANPLPLSRAVLPAESPKQSGVLTTIRAQQQQQVAAPQPSTSQPSTAPAAAGSAPVAPPREVFVAASVRPQTAAPQSGAEAVRTPPAQNAAAQPEVPPPVETRIASAQTAARGATARPEMPRLQAATVPVLPAIASRVAAQSVRTVSDLLRAAGLSDNALTRTAAALSQQAPARLLPVLARLEKALAQQTGDARIPSLRTIIDFTSRLNLQNEETLPSQISAYVSHVIEGAEAKIQQLLAAHVDAEELPQRAIAAPGGVAVPDEGSSAAQTAGESAPAAPAAVPLHASHATVAARVVERSANADHDLKTLVLSLLRNPPAGRTATLMQALNETVIALTGTQLNVLSANLQNPDTITLPLPAYFYEGGKPAYLRISRDGKSASQRLDADNFHVAFVLDTANLGTVAIDMQTSGRAVKVDVKTEGSAAAATFSGTLDALRTRLEKLKYRIASATASVLNDGNGVQAQRTVVQRHRDMSKGVDPAKRTSVDLHA